jgi:hypothetical protein
MKDINGIAGVTRSIATSSVINPTLILSAICTPLALSAGYFSDGLIKLFFLIFAAIPPGLACWQIIKFTKQDPDRLQNERHVENKMMISQMGARIGSDGKDMPVEIGGKLESNPALKLRNGE